MAVWMDATSTQHNFTSTVVAEEVAFTYITTATDGVKRLLLMKTDKDQKQDIMFWGSKVLM